MPELIVLNSLCPNDLGLDEPDVKPVERSAVRLLCEAGTRRRDRAKLTRQLRRNPLPIRERRMSKASEN